MTMTLHSSAALLTVSTGQTGKQTLFRFYRFDERNVSHRDDGSTLQPPFDMNIESQNTVHVA